MDIGERLELSAGADVPDTHGTVGAERREPRAVRAEPGREDAAAMRTQHVNRVAGGGIPEPRGAVGASGGDEPAVRGVPDREDLSCMSGEPDELLACEVANARRPALQAR